MSSRYPIPGEQHQVEEDIQRSRFITILAPATTVAEASEFIDMVRKTFPDATHHCWAYLVGAPGSSGQVGMSDDGEPHGTAGRPMLNVLSHSGVGDIAAVVVRYYGGTKLGKGGLVRAYGGGVKQALESLTLIEKVSRRQVTITIAYPAVTLCRRLLDEFAILVEKEEYAAEVSLSLAVPEDQWDGFMTALENLTNGTAKVTTESP